MTRPFVHLHLHTEFSIVDSTVRIPSLMAQCAEFEMPAVALTDQSNLFGLVKFYRKAFAHGIKPLIGVDLKIRNAEENDRPFSLLLLCQNLVGYRNLTRLVSRSYLEGQQRGVPMVDLQWLNEETTQGLLALSGGLNGDIGRALSAGQAEQAGERMDHWQTLFGDRFYLEVTRLGRAGEEACLQAAIKLAAGQSVPVVATNDVRFIQADDFNAHEARVCIQQGRTLADPERPRNYSEHQYLKSAAEMAALFDDIPEAIDNTVEIARRCNLDLRLGESFLPEFPVPEGQTTEEFLIAESGKGLEAFLQRKMLKDDIAAEQFNVTAGALQGKTG